MEMEKLEWITVEYPITDFAPIGKVITQRDVLEKYKTDNPGQEIKALTGFKYDHQDKTVSLRIGVADPTIAADSGTAAKIEGVEAGENPVGVNLITVANIEPHGQKLQYPGYDGLVKKYNKLKAENKKLKIKLKTADETYEGLRTTHAKLFKEYGYLDRLQGERVKEAMAQEIDLGSDEDEAVENKEPVTNNDTNTVLTEAIIKRACDQAEVVGPDDDTVSEDDKNE